MLQTEILEARFVAQSGSDTERTRDMVFYSGATVDRFDWYTGEVYQLKFSLNTKDVDLSRLNNGAPLLNSHKWSLSDVVGVVKRAWIENGQAMATVQFSERDEVKPIWQDVQSGIIHHVSMGALVRNRIEVTPKGSKMKVFLANEWEPQEISLVPVPADPGASLLSAAMQQAPQNIARLLEQVEQLRATKSDASGAAAHNPDDLAKARLHLRLAVETAKLNLT